MVEVEVEVTEDTGTTTHITIDHLATIVAEVVVVEEVAEAAMVVMEEVGTGNRTIPTTTAKSVVRTGLAKAIGYCNILRFGLVILSTAL